MNRKLYNDTVKRSLDIMTAATGIVLLSPLFALIALVLFVRNPGRCVIFTQMRPGEGGRPFKIYKFRSMRDAYDAEGKLLPDEQRLPEHGSFLRRSGLDELPQLWNVLCGEMSIVGPRPLLPCDLDRAPSGHSISLRHSVRPGITGWVQVNGRNAIPWSRKFELDEWYVRHMCLRLDLCIILRTFGVMLTKERNVQRGQS